NLDLPTIGALLLLVPACGAAGITYAVKSIEPRLDASTGQRMALMGLVVALPMFLFGTGLGVWAVGGGIAWYQAVFALVLISLVATVIENGRLAGMIAAQVALWTGVACVASPFGALLTGGFGAAIAT